MKTERAIDQEWLVADTFAFDQESPAGPYPVLPCGQYVRKGMKFEITPEKVSQFVANFNAGIPNRPPVTNIEHESQHGAVGWVKTLIDKGAEGLYALIDWTEKGLQLLREESFRYLSPEVYWTGYEDTDGKLHDNVFFGLALTNYPWFGERLALYSDHAEGGGVSEYFEHMNGESGHDLVTSLEKISWQLHIEEGKEEPDADKVRLLTDAKTAIKDALLYIVNQFDDSAEAVKLVEEGLAALADGTSGKWLEIRPKLDAIFAATKKEEVVEDAPEQLKASDETVSLLKRLGEWLKGQETEPQTTEETMADKVEEKVVTTEVVTPEPVTPEPVVEKETPVVDATAFADVQAEMAKMSDRLDAADKINADQKAALDISNAEVDKFKDQFTESEQKRRVAEFKDTATEKFSSLPGTVDETGVLLMWAFDNDTTEKKTMYGKFTDMLAGANAAYAEQYKEQGHLDRKPVGTDLFMVKVNERAAQYREQNSTWTPEKAETEALSAISKEDKEGAVAWDKRTYE